MTHEQRKAWLNKSLKKFNFFKPSLITIFATN